MREILFRGKLSHSGEWITGNLITARNGNLYIIPPSVFESDGHHLIIDSDSPFLVLPETIGQFTGLTDKTGTKIFEDDIIEVLEDENKKTDNNPCYFNYGDIGEVIFEQRYCAFNLYNREQEDGENMGNLIRDDAFNFCKVIGNIHDNHELLTEI